jgi:hypothetical protein
VIKARDFVLAFGVMLGFWGAALILRPVNAGNQTVGGVTFNDGSVTIPSGDTLTIADITSSGIAYVYSSSSGALDSISAADLLDLEAGGTAAVGDLFYVSSTNGHLTRLAAGATSGHVLTSNGSGAAPSYQAAGGGGGTLAACVIYRNTAQSIASGAPGSTIAFDTEDFDTDGSMANLGSNRIDIQTTGYYYVRGAWEAQGLDDGEYAIAHVTVNGGSTTGIRWVDYSSGTNKQITVAASRVMSLTAGDYLQLLVTHSEGANMNTQTGESTRPYLMAVHLQ